MIKKLDKRKKRNRWITVRVNADEYRAMKKDKRGISRVVREAFMKKGIDTDEFRIRFLEILGNQDEMMKRLRFLEKVCGGLAGKGITEEANRQLEYEEEVEMKKYESDYVEKQYKKKVGFGNHSRWFTCDLCRQTKRIYGREMTDSGKWICKDCLKKLS